MRTVLALATITLLVACGDNIRPGGGDDDDADASSVDATTDGVPVDARICPGRLAGEVGGPCTTHADCDSAANAGDGICFNNTLDPAPWPAQGYCLSRAGGCTMDSECGAGNVCIDLGGGARGCMLGCAADPCACPDGMICSDGYLNTPVQRMVCVPGNRGAIDGSACQTFGDCDEHSICLDDGHEHPGGQCMQLGCTIGNDTTCNSGGDGHCSVPDLLGGGTGCLDQCTVDADCRMIDGYVCHDAGGTVGKFCRHPAVGDACTGETDCGIASLWECRTGGAFPGGYCTIQQVCDPVTHAGCPPGSSICYDPPGTATAYCLDRCATVGVQSNCRTGYTCTDVDPSASVAAGCL